MEEEGIVTYAVNPGFALKVGGAKRVLFTLEQKEVMIEFYNRHSMGFKRMLMTVLQK